MKFLGFVALIAFNQIVWISQVTALHGTYVGCFRDTSDRDLSGRNHVVDRRRMTVEKCVGICREGKFRYAGLQVGSQCHCGSSYGKHGRVADSECTWKCSGDKSRYCGQVWRNSIYDTGYIGCYVDRNSRDLPGFSTSSNDMTIEKCVATCQNHGYGYAGVQNHDQCFCGSSFGKYGTHVYTRRTGISPSCKLQCKGNRNQICGGVWRNSIYQTGIIGCFKDDHDRDLDGHTESSNKMTVERCVAICQKRGYAYAGLQSYSQCWCGTSYGKHGRRPMTECNFACRGNPQQKCGSNWRNSVYATGYCP